MKGFGAIKKFSLFKIVSIIAISVLAIVIVVQIGIMINLRNKTQKVSEENQEISSTLSNF